MNTPYLLLFGGGLAFASTFSPLHSADTAVDFENMPTVQKESEKMETLTCAIVEDPSNPGSNKVLSLKWEAWNGTHIGVNLTANRPILFDKPGKYQITAKVNLEQVGSECQNLALRAIDKTGEVFQISAKFATPGEPGWQEIKWELDTENFDFKKCPSWGNNKNQVFDMPVRLLGFGIAFKDWKTPGGVLLIDDITVIPAP